MGRDAPIHYELYHEDEERRQHYQPADVITEGTRVVVFPRTIPGRLIRSFLRPGATAYIARAAEL